MVENWDSANSFIFYGKGGEIATNRLEDQELAVLSLHLLQTCLVYINTLMVQQVLSNQQQLELLKPEDLAEIEGSCNQGQLRITSRRPTHFSA
ncbi:hypothetical protein UH38_23360 [Aliterella atlantica CENA595]|uniref:Tn3 transposase DDE domain-containing protein n=1 Tax=Aliterella atlantica CENA595 TaxID=1618023 RepID=A0A0D8ZQQ2_9CYAN|nr:hypothetical protein UH38_23360 [Aliterella atlantica CENA595]